MAPCGRLRVVFLGCVTPPMVSCSCSRTGVVDRVWVPLKSECLHAWCVSVLLRVATFMRRDVCDGVHERVHQSGIV